MIYEMLVGTLFGSSFLTFVVVLGVLIFIGILGGWSISTMFIMNMTYSISIGSILFGNIWFFINGIVILFFFGVKLFEVWR